MRNWFISADDGWASVAVAVGANSLKHTKSNLNWFFFSIRSRRKQQHEKPQTFFSLQTKTEYFFLNINFTKSNFNFVFLFYWCFCFTSLSLIRGIRQRKLNGNAKMGMSQLWNVLGKFSKWKITENTHFNLLLEFLFTTNFCCLYIIVGALCRRWLFVWYIFFSFG